MNKKNYLLFFFVGCISLLLFLFGNLLFPQTVSSFNQLASEFFYYLNPKKGLAENIVVVQIDDYSLSKINKTWPFPRSAYTKALNVLKEEEAAVIGFDVVFQGQGPSEDDDALFKEALQSLKEKVVLAAYFNSEGELESFQQYGQDAEVTFVRAIPGRDGLIKGLQGVIKHDSLFKFCWAVEVASRYYGFAPQKQGRNIILGKRAIPLDQGNILSMNYLLGQGNILSLNYLLKPKDFNTISFYDLIEGNFPPGFLKGKIVLVGSTAEIVHDIFPTPLGRMPGVFIQANEIVGILKAKYLTPTHPAVILAVLFLSLAIVALMIISFSLLKGLVFCLGTLLSLFWLSLGLKFLGWNLPFGSLALALLGFFVLGNLYNYFRFLTVLTKIKSEMTVDPFSRLFKLRYLYERLNLDLGSFPRKKLRVVVISLAGLSQSTKGRNFDSLRKLWEEIGSVLFGSGELWARCTQEAIVGATTQNLDLNELKKELDALFFEQETKVIVKVGMFKLVSSLSVRDVVPFVVSELLKDKLEVVLFDSSRLPQHRIRKLAEADYISSLYTDSETKNQELLEAIGKRIEEEGRRQKTYLQVITTLVNALESKDPYTEGHSEKVCKYSLLLAETIGLSADEQIKIKTAALLHDLGKIGIPDRVLHKKGKLTDEEFAFIKEHEILSVKILEPLEEFKELLPYILHHHEDYNGAGYPHGLAGEFIPLGARIIAIADVFDALTTGRDYKDAFSVDRSLEILVQEKGKRFDPDLVDAFVKIINKDRKPPVQK